LKSRLNGHANTEHSRQPTSNAFVPQKGGYHGDTLRSHVCIASQKMACTNVFSAHSTQHFHLTTTNWHHEPVKTASLDEIKETFQQHHQHIGRIHH